MAARENLHVRATEDQRARWSSAVGSLAIAAQEAGQQPPSESEWIRQGLDTWAEVTARATALGMDPGELAIGALEAFDRGAAAVLRLVREQEARALTATEDAVLRALAPHEWERLGRAGALTLPPADRRG